MNEFLNVSADSARLRLQLIVRIIIDEFKFIYMSGFSRLQMGNYKQASSCGTASRLSTRAHYDPLDNSAATRVGIRSVYQRTRIDRYS